jgi:hypothetical protein
MEGKGVLFKIFADIDVFDIEVDASDPEHFIQTVKAIAPTFGGINLEDIKAPEAFEIERRLKEELDIPIMHDDQHGTAIISSAALLNALELAKKLEAHSAVDYVLYPGLASHKNHERHMSQASGGGQVVCFVLKGDVEQAEKFCNSLKIWAHATSLGGVESTIERRRRWPVEPIATPETLIRASVGIEKVEDLSEADQVKKSIWNGTFIK